MQRRQREASFIRFRVERNVEETWMRSRCCLDLGRNSIWRLDMTNPLNVVSIRVLSMSIHCITDRYTSQPLGEPPHALISACLCLPSRIHAPFSTSRGHCGVKELLYSCVG